MSAKSLEEKAINIKGKQYVLVSDRVKYFNDHYPNGAIQTQLLAMPGKESKNTYITKTIVTPDVTKPERCFTGLSQATIGDGYINKTSALENCETSSLGRALGMMAIGVIDAVASPDEINKSKYNG